MSVWEKDEISGRYYREIGKGCREYQTDMLFSSGYKADDKAPVEKRQSKRCPFKSIVNSVCVGDGCALFVEGACILSKLSDQKPARNTTGLRCPINKEARQCSADCAVFNDGCSLTAITGRK